ncbi:ricin-type beta-trefoil lectin domain protein [Streptomyces sp. NPDC005533]|uniref:ricin-type beta-trefoil lectin domain protein n=1 Tax=Streptomyces sp. NPDC005533 TaxID=3364723 RepID=UPI0036BD4195
MVKFTNGLDVDLQVFRSSDCTGDPVALIAAGGEKKVNVKTGPWSMKPTDLIIEQSAVMGAMREAAPLPKTISFDHAGMNGIVPYASDAEGASERSAKQNTKIETDLRLTHAAKKFATYWVKGQEVGGNVPYVSMKYKDVVYKEAVYKDGWWHPIDSYDPIASHFGQEEVKYNAAHIQQVCAAGPNCQFYGVLLSDNPGFNKPAYADYPVLTTSATVNGNPIKSTQTTSASRTDTVTTGWKVGVSATFKVTGGGDKGAIGGEGSVTPTYEYNYSRAIADGTVDTGTLEVTYPNPANRKVYLQARTNVGWYSGYLLIRTQQEDKTVTGTAIPLRMKVQSPETDSPATWLAAYVSQPPAPVPKPPAPQPTPSKAPVPKPPAPQPTPSKAPVPKPPAPTVVKDTSPVKIRPRARQELCWNVDSGLWYSGNNISVEESDCSGKDDNTAQEWTFAANGELQAGGGDAAYCATLRGSFSAAFGIRSCGDENSVAQESQQYRRYSDDTIHVYTNAGVDTGQCLQYYDLTAAGDDSVEIASCNAAQEKQKWNFYPYR